MTNIVIGTTPTITYTFEKVSPSDIVTARFTIKLEDEIIIDKSLEDATVGENTLEWDLTQQETLALGENTATMMINFVTSSGKRGVSLETAVNGIGNHIPEVI